MSRTEVEIEPEGLAALSGPEVWSAFRSSACRPSFSAAYGTLVHLASVAGGRLADRVLGSYRAVLWGGALIACGHYAMSAPTGTLTGVGLGLISAGTGLLKPKAATMVGKLYATDDDRRDAGFALYYMAIDIGAFAGPLVTGRLGDRKGRHRGFSEAAIGLTVGLIQYVLGRRHLAERREAAELALAPAAMRRAVRLIVVVMAAAPWLRRTMHPVH